VAPDFRHAVSTLEELHDHVLLNVEIHGVQRDLHGSASSNGAEAIEHVRQIRFPARIDHNAQKPASHSAQPRGNITLPLVAAATVPGADYEIGEILFDGTYDVGDLCGIMRTVGIHEHLDLAGGFPDSHLIRITLAAAVVQDNTSSSLLRQCCGFILGMTVDDDNLLAVWFDGRDETADSAGLVAGADDHADHAWQYTTTHVSLSRDSSLCRTHVRQRIPLGLAGVVEAAGM
jgi:hypothetical protein